LGGQREESTIIVADNLLKICTYILGEFGHYLVMSRRVSSLRLVEIIRRHFPRMSPRCKGIALTAYAKIFNISPNNSALKDEVVMHIQSIKDSIDPDIQQRACELLFLISLVDGQQVLDKVLAMVPPLEGEAGSKNPLVARLKMQTTKTRAATRRALEVAAETGGSMYKSSQVVDESSGSSGSSSSDSDEE
jgi:hypothetical protein